MASSKYIVIDIIRHGEPEGGDILRGRVNPVLTDLGWLQMRRATGLGSTHDVSAFTPPWTRIVSSPLSRCREFAEATAASTGLPLSTDEQWQEIDYGDWDGMPLQEWRRLAADQFKAFRKDLSALAPPNGEAFVDFKDRILTAWHGLETLADGSHLLLVTHGGVMRVILPEVLGMPLNRSFPLHIPFACISRVSLSVDDGKVTASLLFHNGAEHRTSG